MKIIYPPISDLIPHRKPMILIDELVKYSESFAECRVEINPHSFLCDGEKVPSYVALEYIAQTIAAFSGYRARTEGSIPSLGFLLGVRSFKSKRDYFRVGESLLVRIDLSFFEGSLGSFKGSIQIGTETLVSTLMTTFKPTTEQLQQILEGDYE